MALSTRAYIVFVGLSLLIAGFVALRMPIELDAMDRGKQIVCGNALSPDTRTPKGVDDGNRLGRTLSGGKDLFDITDYKGECSDKIKTRRAWGWPLVGAGALVALGGVVVGIRPKKDIDTPTGSVESLS
ncbi:hypothetical protein M2284_003455 [Rhodococcus sp. LBL1]|nr:hypothetical protein [Rhodococcus sp. LBL1]MDH6685021.1 hypothetical protein [Rhodococcus sp. LBL2]